MIRRRSLARLAVTRAAMLAVLSFAIGGTVVSAAERAATPLSQYVRSVWTETDGMPSSLVWAMAQDRDGYLWLGTDAGLLRFDGVRFVTWDEIGDAPLPGDTVRALYAPASGGLWVGLGIGGVSYIRNGILTNYTPAEGVPDGAFDIVEDRTGAIWAGGFGGVSRFTNNRWETIGPAFGLPQQGLLVMRLYVDDDGALWMVSSDGLFARAVGADRFVHVDPKRPVRAVIQDQAGIMWGTNARRAIFRLDGTHDDWTAAGGGMPGTRMVKDARGNLWVATLGHGVVRVSTPDSPQGPRLDFLGAEGLLSSTVVRSIFADREGNIWLGSQRGLIRLSENRIAQMVGGDSAATTSVRSVTAGDGDRVWVGTESGLFQLSRSTPVPLLQPMENPTPAVGALHRDRRGVLWVATDGGGVSTFENNRFVPQPIPKSARLTIVEALTTDHDGGLWMCDLVRGVHLWKDGTLTSFETDREVRGRIALVAVTDRVGRVWLGFADGTVVVRAAGKFTAYSAKEGLAGGSVSSIAEDNQGRIWVGSDNGLSRLEHDGRFTSLTTGQGLPGHNIRAVVHDAQGFIWFGVSSGIVRLDPGEFDKAVQPGARGLVPYALYDRFDGLRGVPMSVRGYPTSVLAGDGKLWFATSNGLAVIDPVGEEPRRVPPVVIERVMADDRIISLDSPTELDPLTSRLYIEYTGLTLTAPGRLKFRYKLEGFDADWINADTKRHASYTNLPPRQYRFHVGASNGGAWNTQDAVWEFSIRPTFYQTRLFLALSLLTIAAMVAGAWKMRSSRIHRQFSLVIGERARVAREIHDTLLQSLVGVAFQFDALSNEMQLSPDAAQSRLERLRRQVGMYIREARQSIWDLRSPMLDSRPLPDALRSLTERFADGGARVYVSVTGIPQPATWRTEEALYRIGQEAMTNSIQHAAATRVDIELVYADRSVTLRVTDDGHGLDGEATPIGHVGLAIMRERAQLIGATFALSGRAGQGTEVTVVAPVGDTGAQRSRTQARNTPHGTHGTDAEGMDG